MIKKIVVCILLLNLISCQIKRNSHVNSKSSPSEKGTSFNYASKLPVNVNNGITKNGKLWMDTWIEMDNTFSVDQFEKEFQKKLDLTWFEYDDLGDYIRSFDSLFISSKMGKLIDLYSYNTIFEKKGDSLYVQFGVDTKVYIDNGNNKRADLITSGSIEIIEDALWIGEDEVVLLGHLIEEELTPFVWIFNLKEKIQARYIIDKTFSMDRPHFLFYKYPNLGIN